MPDLLQPVSPAHLSDLGFCKETAEAAAQEIAELVHAIFGPFDPVAEEVWRAAETRELGPADLSSLFADALGQPDPLSFLDKFPLMRSRLEHLMRVRWSSRRARALDHPEGLRGQAWAALSKVAQEEVREGLRHLSALERGQVRRGPSKDSDVDTFLLGLAEIMARHTGYTLHETGLSSYTEGDFIGLAQVVLGQLPPLPSGRPRIHPKFATTSALSTRWRRTRKLAQTGLKPSRPRQ